MYCAQQGVKVRGKEHSSGCQEQAAKQVARAYGVLCTHACPHLCLLHRVGLHDKLHAVPVLVSIRHCLVKACLECSRVHRRLVKASLVRCGVGGRPVELWGVVGLAMFSRLAQVGIHASVNAMHTRARCASKHGH